MYVDLKLKKILSININSYKHFIYTLYETGNLFLLDCDAYFKIIINKESAIFGI